MWQNHLIGFRCYVYSIKIATKNWFAKRVIWNENCFFVVTRYSKKTHSFLFSILVSRVLKSLFFISFFVYCFEEKIMCQRQHVQFILNNNNFDEMHKNSKNIVPTAQTVNTQYGKCVQIKTNYRWLYTML